MGREDLGVAAWRPLYLAERDATLISRVRVVVAVIVPVVLILTPYMILKEPETLVVRVILGLLYVVLAACVWLASRRSDMQRYAIPLNLAFVGVLLSTTVVYWWVTPHEGPSALSCMMVIMMASSLMLPWGAWPQAVVSAASVVSYLAVTHRVPDAFDTFSLSLMIAMAPVIVLGAGLMENYRQQLFAQSWLRGQFVAVARRLADHDDPVEVVTTALEEGVDLLRAEGAGWMYVRGERVFRMVAVVGGQADPSWIGFEMDETLAPIQQLLEQRMLVLPEDASDGRLDDTTQALGIAHSLHAAMFYGSEIVGILSFSRALDVPFGRAERAAAETLADQTAAALRGARLVTDLRQANELRSQFVSTMSHELRTPLNVILGFVDMARDPKTTPEERAQCLERVDVAGRDLLELIESTLQIGRLEAGRDATELVDVSLTEFWGHLGTACATLPRAPAVLLRWTPVGAATLRTDPRKLTLVIRNLVGNALKFTEQGHVQAEVLPHDTDLILRVCDTGPGIDPAQQQVVFDMFRQGDGSDSRIHGGTGLGLYIVRRFVEQLGGTVELDSVVGRGSTFTVRLVGAIVTRDATEAA